MLVIDPGWSRDNILTNQANPKDGHYGQSVQSGCLLQSAYVGEPGEGGQLVRDQRQDQRDGGGGVEGQALPPLKRHKAHIGSHKAAPEGGLW